MKIIGLTGGIGSGKTTVANFFKDFGVPVYIADLEAKKIMETSQEIRAEIIKNFGEEAYEGCFPNRKFLAKVVFQDNEKLEILNSIIHPAVAKDFNDWVAKQKFPYVIYEAAILFEKGNYKNCDSTIVVTAPKEIRLERVSLRDKTTFQEIEARMDKQWSDEKKIALADFVIENINLSLVKEKVKKIHQHLLSLA